MKLNQFSCSYLTIVLTAFLLLVTSWISAQVIEIQRLSTNKTDLFFLHKIRKSETMFSIARTYGLSLEELSNYNTGITGNQLKEDQDIRIPVTTEDILNDSVAGALLIVYKVQAKDNLFALSHRIFNKSKNQLEKLNLTKTLSMHPGNLLKIGYFKMNVSAESVLAKEVLPQIYAENKEEAPIEVIPHAAISRGLAYVEGNSLGEGRYFALHSTAPIESSIAITNPVNMRTIYAKVIGRIPPIYEPGTQVVVSSSVARFLGIPDNRFYAEIKYQRLK